LEKTKVSAAPAPAVALSSRTARILRIAAA
jgi:hypothetical protein